MRHSDPRLTSNIYTHGVAELERAAIEALPNLFEQVEKKSTGTDNQPFEVVAKNHSAIHSAKTLHLFAEHCKRG